MKKHEREIYERCEAITEGLDLAFYPKIVLTAILYCKVKNPFQRTDEAFNEALMNVVPDLLVVKTKKKYLPASAKREIENLECSLDMCDSIPEEVKSGYIVSGTVKWLLNQLIDQSEDDANVKIEEE